MTSASGEDPKLLKTAIDWAIKWKEDSTKSCNFYDLIIKQYSVKEVDHIKKLVQKLEEQPLNILKKRLNWLHKVMQTKSEETNTHIGVNIQKQVAGVYKPQKTVTANSIESSNKNYQTAIESINESYQLPYIDDEDVADYRGMNKASKSCQSVVIEMPPDDKIHPIQVLGYADEKRTNKKPKKKKKQNSLKTAAETVKQSLNEENEGSNMTVELNKRSSIEENKGEKAITSRNKRRREHKKREKEKLLECTAEEKKPLIQPQENRKKKRTIKEYKQEQRMRGAALQTLRYSACQFGQNPCIFEKPKKIKQQVKKISMEEVEKLVADIEGPQTAKKKTKEQPIKKNKNKKQKKVAKTENKSEPQKMKEKSKEENKSELHKIETVSNRKSPEISDNEDDGSFILQRKSRKHKFSASSKSSQTHIQLKLEAQKSQSNKLQELADSSNWPSLLTTSNQQNKMDSKGNSPPSSGLEDGSSDTSSTGQKNSLSSNENDTFQVCKNEQFARVFSRINTESEQKTSDTLVPETSSSKKAEEKTEKNFINEKAHKDLSPFTYPVTSLSLEKSKVVDKTFDKSSSFLEVAEDVATDEKNKQLVSEKSTTPLHKTLKTVGEKRNPLCKTLKTTTKKSEFKGTMDLDNQLIGGPQSLISESLGSLQFFYDDSEDSSTNSDELASHGACKKTVRQSEFCRKAQEMFLSRYEESVAKAVVFQD